MDIAIIEEMPKLDFKTPFDELSELRTILTTQQIAELTGLRRETISRARPDSRFRRRTERALGDLYLVATRMRSVLGDDLGQLAAVLRRPQEELGGRSIAELLREGRVEVVLESLAHATPRDAEGQANLRLDPEVEAQLTPWREPSEEEVRDPVLDEKVDAVLAADPELDSRLGAIEKAIRDHFGPGSRVERQIISPYDVPEGSDELYLRVHSDLSLDEEIDRLGELLRQEEDLLAPVRRQLVIGFLG